MQNKTLALIAIVLTILVAVVYFQRHQTPKRLPDIVKPTEDWLRPSDVSVVDGDTIRAKGAHNPLSGLQCARNRQSRTLPAGA
ncbi:MAG: hypothetical protein ABWY66_11365 [Xanthobacteraceae bacterium]|jgi:hypothetical protein